MSHYKIDGGHVAMARVAMTGTAAADPVADGAGAQAPATVVPPGMRSGPWNRSDRAQLEDAVSVARLFLGYLRELEVWYVGTVERTRRLESERPPHRRKATHEPPAKIVDSQVLESEKKPLRRPVR